MNLALTEQIAKAVLYEGYMLYPYRPSSVKNQQRWNFGVLYPRAYSLQQSGSDTFKLETECLVESHAETSLEIRVRFLQLVQRSIGLLKTPVQELGSGARPELQMVDALSVDGKLLQSWQEAIEREVMVPVADLQSASSEHEFSFSFESETEPVRDERGVITALILRHGERITGKISVATVQVREGVTKLSLVVENNVAFDGVSREQALLSSMVSAHVVLGVERGNFVSLLETPASLREEALGCQNKGVWPVLVGAEGQRDTLLVSPIILYDYPQIAPESAGDLFDGTEIDEILSLRIMTLTDEEKSEMRQSDERARQILERTETLPEEQFMKLHGVLRGLRPVKEDRP
jgi:hypothetical protein